MANKYLEKIAETLSEQEVQHEAGKNVSRKYLGRILGAPIPGGAVLGAHLLGKGQINALEESLNRPKSNHKTVAHNQVRATIRGGGEGILGAGVGMALGAAANKGLAKTRLAGIGQRLNAALPIVGGVSGSLHGEYAGTKNWMRRMYGEGSDTSSK